MSFYTIQIPSHTLYPGYGINSSKSYQIKSACTIEGNEVKKIQALLGAFVDWENAKEAVDSTRVKFDRYVSWKPQEEWANVAEYELYQSAQRNLKGAEENLENIKQQYSILSISPLI